MATETIKRCDIYDSPKYAKTFAVQLYELDDDGNIVEGDEDIMRLTADMCPRAVDRAKKLIRRAFTKPQRNDGK